jgi:hypothetical protein
MAKLLVLERHFEDDFRKILDWLNKNELEKRLKKIEEAENADALDEDDRSLFSWAKDGPTLSNKELGPYLRLAASLTSAGGIRTELRPDLQEILEKLAGSEAGPRKEAAEKAAGLPIEDRLEVVRELVGVIVTDPSRQDDVGQGLALIGSDDAVAAETMARLTGLGAGSVEAELIIRIEKLPGAHDVIRSWLESDGLGDMAETAAKNALGEGGT